MADSPQLYTRQEKNALKSNAAQRGQADSSATQDAARKEQALIKQLAQERMTYDKQAQQFEQQGLQDMAKEARRQQREKLDNLRDVDRITTRTSTNEIRNEQRLSQQRKQDAQEQARRQSNRGGEIAGARSRAQFVDDVKITRGFQAVSRFADDFRNVRGDATPASVLKMFGDVAGAFGPWGQAIQGATSALNSLDQAFRHASDEIRGFQTDQYTSGGNSREQARGQFYAETLGVPTEKAGSFFANKARNFADKITTDPYAMGYANRAGIHDMPGAMGKLDKAGELLDWINRLRQLPEAEARRAARATDTEEFLPLRRLNPENWQKLQYGAEKEARYQNSPEALDAFNDKAREVIDANRHLQDRASRFGIGGSRRDADAAMPNFEDWQRQRGNDPMDDAIYKRNRQDAATLDGGGRPSQNGDVPHIQTLNGTLQELNATMAETNSFLRPGLYGGGDRARGAIPNAYWQHHGGDFANRQLLATAHALGAFTL